MIYNRRFLRAKKHITCQHSPLKHIAPKVELVCVNDLMITAKLNWLKRRYENFKESIEGAGMIYPIIYTDLEHYWLKEKDGRKIKMATVYLDLQYIQVIKEFIGQNVMGILILKDIM